MTLASRPLLHRTVPPQVFWILLVACALAAPLAHFLLDKPVFDWLAQRRVQWSNLWIDAFRLLGKAWLLIWLLLVWVAITGRWRLPFLALVALLIVMVPVNSLKVLVGRPRPRQVIAAAQAPPAASAESTELWGMSFPSGDTAAAFTVAAALGTVWAWPWTVAALVAAGGVGAMRVVDLAHYPSDVCAGAAIGILAAWVAAQTTRRWSPLAIEAWGRTVAVLTIVGMPIVICFTHGTATLMLLLKSYIPLVLAIYAIAKVRRYLRPAPTNRD
jgi:membrane-associated phospholipid phosphatase